MNKMRYCLFILFVLLLPGVPYAQKIDSMMNVYADRYPQEKLYVQFDKNVYNPGETIWFKAYLFTGADPSTISKNFYAELSDGSGNLLQRKISPLLESSAAGNFDIPAGIKTSHLHVRAYTTWMLNFDTAFIYEKNIPLAIVSEDTVKTNKASESHFQFFPEGGEVIAGLENTIAFKATDQSGLPIPVRGVLKDAAGKDILEFASVHDGMGRILITPEQGDSLYAVWKDDQGIEHQTAFPKVRPSGVVLHVINTSKKVFFSVARSSDSIPEYNRLVIIAHMNQQLVYKAMINLTESFMSGGSIPVDKLPSGVLQLTVLNTNNRPMAERVVFVNNHDYSFSPDVGLSQKNVGKKGENMIDIDLPDTLSANLSLAVTDFVADGKQPYDDNIVSRLLLTGEVRGYVHDPYYYFSNNSDSTMQHLDLVMLTHGWRRFKWEQLAAGKVPVIKYPVENYLALKVDVFGVDPTRISRDENIYVILKKKDSSVQMITVPKLAGAKFGAAGLVFYDTARAFYQFSVDRSLSNQAAIVFNNGTFPGYKKIKPALLPYRPWSALDSALLQKNRFVTQESARIKADERKVQVLESVTVKGRAKSPEQKLDEEYTSGMFSGGDAYSFDLVDDPISTSYPDIFTYLQGKVPGLSIVNTANSTSLQWRGATPSLYLNEMQIDPATIRATSVADVAMVKVFRPGSGVGFGGGANGVIAVYTKKGGGTQADPSFKGLDHAQVVGYSGIREFYAPDYVVRPELREVEDVRTTLYWKPWILTDKSSRHISIRFYNNDISKKLRLVLEGFNADGKLTRVEKIIE
ncbi:MAG TPA: hypothetical protein VMI35_05885 [Puia sp.]|nr:hypothetical protein [Puia sp.]